MRVRRNVRPAVETIELDCYPILTLGHLRHFVAETGHLDGDQSVTIHNNRYGPASNGALRVTRNV